MVEKEYLERKILNTFKNNDKQRQGGKTNGN